MSVIYRQFKPIDIHGFTKINSDPMVEAYNIGFYFQYWSRWKEYFLVATTLNGEIAAFIMGKDEGLETDHHGHVTAITVRHDYRKRGIARQLMQYFEETSIEKGCYFVDLFVRKSNTAAIRLYEKLGYVVYREIKNYYSGKNPENAYEMRKALPRDADKKSVVPIAGIVDVSSLNE
ncbi:unnamed protein product, partial [Mesorhabditis spiculigera]